MSEDALFSDNWHQFADLRVALRPDVVITRQFFRGERWYVLRDAYSNKFYRFRSAPYQFIALLDGRRTVEQAWEKAIESNPDAAPGQRDVLNILAQLHSANLLRSDLPPDAFQMFRRRQKEQAQQIRSQLLNFLFLRIPLLDPDPLLNRMSGLIRVLVSRPMAILWLVLMFFGLKAVIDKWALFTDQAQQLLAPGNLPLLYLTWIIVKVFHEFGHGAVCKRFGAEVHRAGVMLLVFTPIPFLDATAAWGFRERWKRVLTGAAGMIFELALAAIAAIVWANTADGAIHQVAYNIIFFASVSTVLFNANPLLRFDGYYILSDLVDVPNLHQQCSQQWRYLTERFAFGLRSIHPPSETRTGQAGLAAFGAASSVYRVFVLAVIVMFIGQQFFGLGLLIAVFGAIVWGFVPLFKFFNYVATSPRLERQRNRALGVTAGALTVIVLVLAVMPFRDGFRATGVVEASDSSIVYAESQGWVSSVEVLSGQWVEQGEVILRMRNRDMELQYLRLEQELAEIDARLQWAEEEQPALLDPLLAQRASALENLAAAREQLENLIVRAPQSGVWAAPYLADFKGAFIKRGAAIGNIVDQRNFVFRAIVTQDEASRLFDGRIRGSSVRILGQEGLQIDGDRFTVLAGDRRRLPSPALGWSAGGSIPVDARDEQGTQTVEPFFEVRIDLPAQVGPTLYHLRPGQARFALPPRPLLWQWVRELRQLLQDRYAII